MRYLSLDWIDAVAAEAASSADVSAAVAVTDIGVTQVVTEAPEGTIVYSLQVDGGTFNFVAGPAHPEHVRFEQTWETAVEVATGTLNAQEAFIQGRILLTGDQQKLMDNQAIFGAMSAVFDRDRKSTRLNSSHGCQSRMPSSA